MDGLQLATIHATLPCEAEKYAVNAIIGVGDTGKASKARVDAGRSCLLHP